MKPQIWAFFAAVSILLIATALAQYTYYTHYTPSWNNGGHWHGGGHNHWNNGHNHWNGGHWHGGGHNHWNHGHNHWNGGHNHWHGGYRTLAVDNAATKPDHTVPRIEQHRSATEEAFHIWRMILVNSIITPPKVPEIENIGFIDHSHDGEKDHKQEPFTCPSFDSASEGTKAYLSYVYMPWCDNFKTLCDFSTDDAEIAKYNSDVRDALFKLLFPNGVTYEITKRSTKQNATETIAPPAAGQPVRVLGYNDDDSETDDDTDDDYHGPDNFGAALDRYEKVNIQVAFKFKDETENETTHDKAVEEFIASYPHHQLEFTKSLWFSQDAMTCKKTYFDAMLKYLSEDQHRTKQEKLNLVNFERVQHYIQMLQNHKDELQKQIEADKKVIIDRKKRNEHASITSATSSAPAITTDKPVEHPGTPAAQPIDGSAPLETTDKPIQTLARVIRSSRHRTAVVV